MAKASWAIADGDFRKVIADIMADHGADAATQRDYIIAMFLLDGDTRPYIEAVLDGDSEGYPGPLVQAIIAAMLGGPEGYRYHLKLERRAGLRGRPKITGGVWRDTIIWLVFKRARAKGLTAETAFEEISEKLGMSAGSVKAAVTRFNKMRARPPANS
jgi:hypothetical protein